MSSPLFSFPPGLLGYLRQKVGGQAPDKFGDTLTPVMNVGELYGRAENLVDDVAAAAAGNFNLFTVPGNERWWLLGYSAIGTQVGAGAVANAVLTTDSGANSAAFWLSQFEQYTGGAVAGQFTITSLYPRGTPWVLEPGSRLGISFLFGSTFTANWMVDGTARILRLPI